MSEVLYVRGVDAVLDPVQEEVRRCTLAAVAGRCRVLAADDTGSVGAGVVLDGAGLVAVPGLIDAHVHWGGAARERWSAAPPASGEAELAFSAFLPEERAACLASGITSIKSMGDSLDWILAMRAAAAGGLPGPRAFAAGPLFTAPGGHPAGDLFRGDDRLIREVCRLFGPGQERAAAAEVGALAGRGIDAVKVVYDGRSGLARLDAGVLGEIIAAAHAHGLYVHAHVGTAQEALAALARGADVIEHVPDPGDAGADAWERVGAALRARGAAICPTLVAAASFVPPSAVAHMGAWVAGLAVAGVPVHAGTDLGNPGVACGAGLHDELELLRRGGMMPGQAIAAATALPGALLPGHAAGRIDDGALADWVLVRGDPLGDLGALRQPAAVIQGGCLLAGTEREGLVG